MAYLKTKLNARNRCDGLNLLRGIRSGSAALVFFDPQYRTVLDKLNYGNEGARQKGRALLKQMDAGVVLDFATEIERILRPSGHIAYWMDKFILCNYAHDPLFSSQIVDLVTWDKLTFGMGYRTRRRAEYLMILQKSPVRAKGVWTDHAIPDVWAEKAPESLHPHAKPVELQRRLILAVTQPRNLIVDPCAGGYGILDLCLETKRRFIGCDIGMSK